MRLLLAAVCVWAAPASASAGRAGPPAWTAPAPGTFAESMAVTGVVRLAGVELRAPGDRVAAFVGGQVRGVAAPTLVGGRRIFFLSIAGDAATGDVTFRAYDAAADRVVDVQPHLRFAPLQPAGTAARPLVWTPAAGGGPPVWTPDGAAHAGSMTVTARLVRRGAVVSDALVGAFVASDVRGATPLQPAGSAGPLAFLTVYGDPERTEPVRFRAYLPSADSTFDLAEGVALVVGTSIGTVGGPRVLTVVESGGAAVRPGMVVPAPAGWRMLAPFGSAATPAVVLAPLWTQGFPGADTPAGAPTVFRYDEATASYAAPTRATEPWGRGEGRMVYVYADDDPRTPAVDGGFPKTLLALEPTAGPHTFAVTRSVGGTGWNLLGNPFPVPVHWDAAGWSRSDLSGSVYVWDPGYLGGTYRVWNGTAGSLAEGVIPAGSGFWVEATGPSPALSVSDAAGAVTAHAGSSARSVGPFGVTLALASAERPTLGARAYISFQPDAAPPDDDRAGDGSNAPDAADALVLQPLVPDFLTLGSASDAHRGLLAIDARPVLGGTAVTVPLAVEAVTAGLPAPETLHLSWPDVQIPDGWSVVITDQVTGDEVDLARVASLEFTVAADRGTSGTGLLHTSGVLTPQAARGGGASPRFVLRVAPGTATSSDAPVVPARLEHPWPNPARASVQIGYAIPTARQARITLTNALGQTLALVADEPHAPGRHVAVADVSGLAAGVYAIRLEAGGEVSSHWFTVVR